MKGSGVISPGCSAAVSESVMTCTTDAFLEILQLTRPTGNCHFFLDGGDSLLASRLLCELNGSHPDLQERLTLTDLLNHPRPNEMARLICSRLPAPDSEHAA